MINGLGYKLANVPTVTGLSSVSADSVISDITSTDTLILNGVDVSTVLAQVPINSNNITLLQQATTGISYSNVGSIDLTTIDNNLTITSGKKAKCATVPTANDDLANKLYVDGFVGTVDLTADNTAGEYYIPFSKTTTTTNNSLYIDTAATPLTYNPSTGAFSSENYTIGGQNMAIGQSSSSLIQSGTNLFLTNNATSGGITFRVYTAANALRVALQLTSSQAILTSPLLLNSIVNTSRQINNTFYNLHDTDSTAGGSYRGRIYTDSASCYLELSGAAHQYFITIGGVNVYQIVSNVATFLNPPLCSTAPTTGNMLCNKNYVDSVVPSLTNYVTTDTTQTITGQKTFDNAGNSFVQPPSCSVAPTTGNMLCNKNYVDSAIGSASYVTLTTTQTNITGQKTFSNASNSFTGSFTGSGSALTGVILTTGNQTAAGTKTFTGDIVMSSGSFNSTIDQADIQFNLANNVLNNTTATITGLIPSVNTSCIVRTDSVAPVTAYGAISGPNITGNGGNNPFFNNFYLLGMTQTTPAIAVTSLSQIQCNDSLNIGSFMTTFIGTRFSLGTYVSSGDLGGGVYNITPNALVASAVKSTTGVSFMTLNRAFTAGGAAAGSITFDYNTTTNLQCKNTSSQLLNAISIKPAGATSDVDMYGNLQLQGSLQYNFFPASLSTSQTLPSPPSQFYLLENTTAITITLPLVSSVERGTLLIFKRYLNAANVTFQRQGTNQIVGSGTLTPTTSIVLAAGTFQCNFISAGIIWFQMF